MRLALLISTTTLVLSISAQEVGTVIKPTTDLGGTTFKNYQDASVFLRGLLGAGSDAYGNVQINKDGSWGQRMGFRLSDVKLTAKEHTTPMEYYGGEVGPRIEITATCSSGPCIKDPMSLDSEPMESKSFFITDINTGKQAFSTLLIMQELLKK